MEKRYNGKPNLTKSFKAAGCGFWYTLRHESSFKYMVGSAIIVLLAMWYFKTSRAENVALLTMIFAVLGLELINTTIERFLDFLNSKHDEKIKIIKDLMASIVLLVSLGAAIIGTIIFLPHIQTLF